MSELRQRHATGGEDTAADGDAFAFDASFGERAHARASDEGPSVGALGGGGAGGAHAGWLLKRHERCLNLCPSWMPGTRPTWRRRYCVLRGEYLFRFAGAHARKPKGTPISLRGMTAAFVGEADEEYEPPSNDAYDDSAAGASAAGTGADDGGKLGYLFRVATLRKEFVFGAPTREARAAWVRALRAAKQHAIKCALGHAKRGDGDAFANTQGARLVQQKRAFEAHEAEQRNQEMQQLLGSGGSSMSGMAQY